MIPRLLTACGWVMAGILYVLVVADLAAALWLDGHNSLLAAAMVYRTQEAFMLLVWIVITLLFLTVED